MKDVIWLKCDRAGVRGMTKSQPRLARDEIPVKLTIVVSENAFATPVLEQTVTVEDWRAGVDVADVQFRNNVITEAEAEMIRRRRIEQMREILEAQGYKITAECTHGDDCLVHEGGIGCDG